MNATVRIMPRAEKDFRSILSYLQERSPAGAVNWRRSFEDCLHQLSKLPEGYGYAPENASSAREIRQILFKTRRGLTYRAVYTVIDGTAHILRIRGPGQPLLANDEMPAE